MFILNKEWNTQPLFVLIVDEHDAFHIQTFEALQTTLKISKSEITYKLNIINNIAIKYFTSILLHNNKIENNKPLPICLDHPNLLNTIFFTCLINFKKIMIDKPFSKKCTILLV